MIARILQLLNLLVDICLLRRGPQDLPASPILTALLVAIYGALVAASEIHYADQGGDWRWAIAAMAFQLGVLYGLLALRGHPERWPQTLSALTGCGAVHLLVFLPLTMSLSVPEGAQVGLLYSLLLLAWIGLFFYLFIIEGSIYRHALAISLPAGVLVSALVYGGAVLLHRALFGAGS